MKESKDVNKWRNIPCSCIETLHIVKMSVLPNLTHRFNANPAEISERSFTDTDKLIQKFTGKGRRPRIANIILKKTKLEDSHNLVSRLVIKL